MNDRAKSPLVSIGVIVYNEEPFIRETLQSLLNQDYPNVELIIADNCSSDDSGAICESIAGSNACVSYTRHAENIGSAANSIFVLEEARGDYFMWAAGHDLWSPDLVSRCVEALQANPQAVIATASSNWIDADGNPLPRESGWYDTRDLGAVRRFFMAFWGNMHPVLGVMRTQCLRDVPRIHRGVGADQILLTELALRGDFIHVSGASWSRRQPRDPETYKQRMQRYTGDDFRLSGNWIDRYLPLLRLPIEQLRSIARSNLGLLDKVAVMLALFPAFVVRWLDGRKS